MRLEDLVVSNNAAADRQVDRLMAKWNRMSNEDRQRWRGFLEEERRFSARICEEVDAAEGQARRAGRQAKQANRRANEQAWDAVRARAAAAAAVSLLGPIVVD